jgi:hypothetical protein
MGGGRLVSYTPENISGYSTPIITEHLPKGAITYNPNGGLLVDTTVKQTGGMRRTKKSRRSSIKRSSKRRRSSIKRSSIKRSSKKSRRSKH